MRNENVATALESIRFIIQHPWLFVSPIIIGVSLVFSYLASRPVYYSTTAIVSLEQSQTELVATKSLLRNQELVDGVLLGENIRNIINQVWPEIKEEKQPAKYRGLVDRLRNPGGISIYYDKSDKDREKKGVSVIYISFADQKPQMCYKVVQATIETIKKTNRDKTGMEIEQGLNFLRKQLEFYKEQLNSIGGEISKIKEELKRKYPTMTDSERYLIDEMLGSSARSITDRGIEIEARAQQIANYESRLTEFKLELLGREKEKEAIERKLRTREFEPIPYTSKEVEDDTFVKGYSSAVTNKELGMAELMSQGFMPEHPDIKKIKNEIGKLKSLRQQRVEDLTSSEGVRGIAEEVTKKRAKDLEAEIATLHIKIRALEDFKLATTKALAPQSKIETVSGLTARLQELTGEKNINQKYYIDIRQQLETAEIRSRLEKENAGLSINIIEAPRVPMQPVPIEKMKTIMFGIIVSIGTGAGLAYLMDSLDTSIKSSSELRELLQIPILASIDRISTTQEVRFQRTRRNSLIIGLIAFIFMSKYIVKFVMRFL